jgi:hypothetical protein
LEAFFFLQHSFEHCPIIILGDFNVNMEKNCKKKELLNFMDKFKLKSQFNKSTIKVASQLDHI